MNVAGFSSIINKNILKYDVNTVEVELALSPLYQLIIVEIGFWVKHWVLVPILFLVFEAECLGVLVITWLQLVIDLVDGHGGIWSHVLPESLLDDVVRSEELPWVDEHLPGRPAPLDELEEGVVRKGNTRL